MCELCNRIYNQNDIVNLKDEYIRRYYSNGYTLNVRDAVSSRTIVKIIHYCPECGRKLDAKSTHSSWDDIAK